MVLFLPLFLCFAVLMFIQKYYCCSRLLLLYCCSYRTTVAVLACCSCIDVHRELEFHFFLVAPVLLFLQMFLLVAPVLLFLQMFLLVAPVLLFLQMFLFVALVLLFIQNYGCWSCFCSCYIAVPFYAVILAHLSSPYSWSKLIKTCCCAKY